MMFTICDHCTQGISPNDGITIHIELNGKVSEFSYHNRTERDCLYQKIRALKQSYQPPPVPDETII